MLSYFLIALVASGCMIIRQVATTTASTDLPCQIFGCGSTDLLSFVDQSFGVNGNYYLNYNSANSTYAGYVITSNNKLIILFDRGAGDYALVRFKNNLELDTTFGTDGWVAGSTGIVSGTPINLRGRISIDSNDNLYIGIEATPGVTSRDLMVLKLRSNGSVDPTFGTAGIATIDYNGADDRIAAITPLSNGNILVTGQVVNAGLVRMGAVKLDANGSINAAYGTAGKQEFIPAGSTWSTTYRSMVNSDGIYLVGGSISAARGFSCSVAKLDLNGEIDPTFGTGGYVIADHDPLSAGGFDICYRIITDSTGNIYAFGESDNGAIVVKITPAGALSPDFSAGSPTTGVAYFTVNSAQDWAHHGAILDNGSIVAIGSATSWGADLGLTVLNTDGSVDTGYNPTLNDASFSSPGGGQFVRDLGASDDIDAGDSFTANGQYYQILTTNQNGFKETVITRLNILN